MILRRHATNGSVKAASGPKERGRSRLGRNLLLILGVGVISGLAALAGIPPFGSLQALLGPISHSLHPQLSNRERSAVRANGQLAEAGFKVSAFQVTLSFHPSSVGIARIFR